MMLGDELDRGDPNSDKAHFYIGALFAKSGDLIKAFDYFQAVKDPTPWKDEIAAARARLETDVIAAARKKAAGS